MNFESFPAPEHGHIEKERVIDTLRAVGIENPEAKELFATWYGQLRETLEAKRGGQFDQWAQFEQGILCAEVYKEAGLPKEAITELNEVLEASRHGERGQYDTICDMLDELEGIQ